jgi:GTPase Era involved in 16S rRNA processing
MNTKRILVFGTPSAGKKNMLNELTFPESNVSHSEVNCTFKIRQYRPVTKDNVEYQFFQVDGLNKTNHEKLTFIEAVNNINNFVQYSEKGFNLLIFVTKCGTIHQSAKDEYIMFVDQITKQKIPILGVVTNCENEEPLSKWIDENENIFVTNGMKFAKMVGTCFRKGGRFETSDIKLREESAEKVWEAILSESTEQPIDLITSFGGTWKFALDIWNNFCAWVGNEIWSEPVPGTMRLLHSNKN